VNYGTALATISHPVTSWSLALTNPGTFRFAVRAIDRAGNEETNTTVVADLTIVGFSLTVQTDKTIYNRGQDVLITGTITADGGGPIGNARVTVDVVSSGNRRSYAAFSGTGGTYGYTFQPLGLEAGSYAVEARALYGGIQRMATADFQILGLLLEPQQILADISMNSAKTVNLNLRNIGDVPLTGLQVSTQDLDPTDPMSIALTPVSLPPTLNPGQTLLLPVVLNAKAGSAPSAPSWVAVRATTTEGETEEVTIQATLHDAVSFPVLTPDPLMLGTAPGVTKSKQASVRNDGYASMAAAGIGLSDPSGFPWIGIINGEFGDVGPGESKEIQIYVNPPSALTLGTYVVPLALTYDERKRKDFFLTVEVTSATTGVLAFRVSDDTANLVVGAQVSLVSKAVFTRVTPSGVQEYNQILQGQTDASGDVQFADVPTGAYRYQIIASGRDPARGEVVVEPGTAPLTIPVVLVTNLVNVAFRVTPTSIQDQYSVELDITYATDLIKPTLQVMPQYINVSFFPEETIQGTLTITNTSNNAPVRNLTLDAATLDQEDRELVVRFLGAEGEVAKIKLADLGPRESATTLFRARIPNPATANLRSRFVGNILASAEYTYSFQGTATTSTTTTPIPVLFQKPQDLQCPAISYLDDQTDGTPFDLKYQGTTLRLAITSNRDRQFTFSSELKGLSAINGGPDAAGLIGANDVIWVGWPGKSTLVSKGDSATFDIDALEGALEAQYQAMPGLFSASAHYIGFTGSWDDRPGQEVAYLCPIGITTLRPSGAVVTNIPGGP
jgi:uncharacterized membrane protein